MKSVLEELEKNYNLFDITNGEIVTIFKFPQDIVDAFVYLLSANNKHYFENCKGQNKSVKEFSKIAIKKDLENNAYLQVIGADERTTLIIYKDNLNISNYHNIAGAKIKESMLIKQVDYIQKRNLERAKISQRFLKEQPDEIDPIKEFNINGLFEYYKYLKYEYLGPGYSKDSFVQNIENIPKSKRNLSNENPTLRKNEIIDYNVRKSILLSYNPKYVRTYSSNASDLTYDAYVYLKYDMVLVALEPISGENYQLLLNLGYIDINDTKYIFDTIKTVLEVDSNIKVIDPAIMRKNHTTLERFVENVDIFLNSAQIYTNFYYDVKRAKEVYSR